MKWREEMRKAKCVSLQNALNILQTIHTRHFQHLEVNLSHVLQDVNEAEDQFEVAVANHSDNINSLLTLQAQRLSELERRFELGVDTFMRALEEEKYIKNQRHKIRKKLFQILKKINCFSSGTNYYY